MLKSKITRIGNLTGIVLPKEILAKLNADNGDDVYFVETEEGFIITSNEPEFEQEMDAARNISRRYRNALRELAK